MTISKRYWIPLALVTGLIAVIAGASLYAYGRVDNSRTFVSSSTAQVVAHQVQVGSINAGRIITMHLDVGDPVLEGQVIATVAIASVISRSGITDTAKIGFRDVQDQRVDVVAPRSGLIAARWTKEGDTVTAGEPIVTLMDQRQVWVEADIREEEIERVEPGQPVEVEVAGNGEKLAGQVETVWPVTATTLSNLAEQSSSSNLRASRPVVRIKITLDEIHPSLIPGSSAQIRIRVR